MITISRRPLPFPAPSVSAVADYCARLKIMCTYLFRALQQESIDRVQTSAKGGQTAKNILRGK